MDVIEQLEGFPEQATSHIVIIGNFDGLHKGHQVLINAAKEKAKEYNCKILMLTFEPHPRRLFRPDDPSFRITPYNVKLRKLNDFGLDYVVSLPFDWEFASQSAESFVNTILIQKLKPKLVMVGEDFCFGQLRKGTPELMKDMGLNVKTISPENSSNGEKFSSSKVRQLLRQGHIVEANHILGWDWEIEGTVRKGDQRGRELGYPTANVPLGETLHPAYGIYACYVQIEGEDEWWPSATNIGIRPMFELQIGQVEAHILNGFNQDIYEKKLRIKPVERLRGEAKFDSLEALCVQMEKDCQCALEILS